VVLKDVVGLIDGNVACGNERLMEDVAFAFASDLMSDVLTIQTNKFILVTGLVTVQTIRTAEMADISNIILVRNKKATPEVLKLALENNMVIIESPFSMFKACGLMFAAGIKPLY
jgi:hypothetical protein